MFKNTTKKVTKAIGRKNSALKMFIKAQDKLRQANEQLMDAFSRDQEKIDELKFNQQLAQQEMASNEDLIGKLSQFTPTNKEV